MMLLSTKAKRLPLELGLKLRIRNLRYTYITVRCLGWTFQLKLARNLTSRRNQG